MCAAPTPIRFAIIAFVAASICALSTGEAAARKTAAFVLDATSGRTLYSQDGHARRYPASLTKMMTLYLLFEDLEQGRVTLNTKFLVSKHAAAQEPTKLWLKPGQTISALDAIHAVVTHSANDAAAVIGEGLAGTEPKFAARMTRTAKSLGMTRTRFANASGLPDWRQKTTAHDMALLGAALQARFPEHYRYFVTRKFSFRGRTYRSHNRLLGQNGVDGIKTGYTRASGFNIVTSVRRGGRKIIVAVMGGGSSRLRDARARRLIKQHFARASTGQQYFAKLRAGIARADRLGLAVATKTTVPVDAATLKFSIRVGALPTRDDAHAAIENAEPYVRKVFDAARPLTQIHEDGDKAYFRAIFQGFPDLNRAKAACQRLKREDIDCYAVVRSAEAR